MKAILFLLLLNLSAFAQEAIPRKSDDDLSIIIAQQRKSQVKNIEYFLNFTLEQNAVTYKGEARLEIELHRLDLPLSVDFLTKTIHQVRVNGVELKKYPARRGSFDIPQSKLAQKLTVEVSYTGEYSLEAGGIQRVKDPEDGYEYIYTDFEPYYAHRLFPSFDQPDIKGIYHLTVLAPKEWKVIHNELIEKEEEHQGKKLTSFKASKPISTYLFFLGAGPFVEWKDNYNGLPLYLYARKSLEKYVDHENIMKTTKAGLKFFNEYFDYPYPFSKYGHVFIPEFAWGGMENPGAVTLNERNIFRGPVPQSKFEKRDNLILHEMAHMWFGDLVTMEWWNDLWLNESFATYLASVAQDRALNSKATWMEFFGTKVWGYWQDQLITTHSIETSVPDVRTAKGNFDGITYAKGASALKQLHFFAGEDGFRNGLRNYFKTYAWSNTKRENFINAIALASKTDLSDWTAKWLQTAGPNRVKVSVNCEEGLVTTGMIEQKASVSQTLAPHRTKVAFYQMLEESLKLSDTFDMVYLSESTPLADVSKKKCPDFIFPNHEDLDYALFSLDPKSLDQASLALTSLPDPLTRLMVWNILHQMVRDDELSPAKYFELALAGLKSEKDDLLLGNLIGRHSPLRDQIYMVYLNKAERALIAPDLEAVVWDRVESAEKGSSLQMTFFDFYLTVAQTPASQMKIYNMLLKNTPPEGISLDQDRRWSALINLSANAHSETLKLIAEELKKDGTTTGKRQALVAKAAFPVLSQKKEMWRELFSNKKLTHSDLDEAGQKMHNPNYPELSQPFLAEYFKRVTAMNWKNHDDVVDVYFERFYPHALCSPELLKMSEKHLKQAKKLTSIARRSWTEAQDELARCVRVRSQVAQSPQKP